MFPSAPPIIIASSILLLLKRISRYLNPPQISNIRRKILRGMVKSVGIGRLHATPKFCSYLIENQEVKFMDSVRLSVISHFVNLSSSEKATAKVATIIFELSSCWGMVVLRRLFLIVSIIALLLRCQYAKITGR